MHIIFEAPGATYSYWLLMQYERDQSIEEDTLFTTLVSQGIPVHLFKKDAHIRDTHWEYVRSFNDPHEIDSLDFSAPDWNSPHTRSKT